MKRITLALICLLAIACGSNSSTTPTPPVTATGLTVNGNTTFTNAGQTSQLTATLMLSNNQQQDQTLAASWTSSNIAVASVSATGVVTAFSTGATTITAAFQGVTGTKAANVTIACQVNNTATVTFRNASAATTQNVIWDGSNVFQLAPGQTSTPPLVAAAGIPHTLMFRDANNRGGGCSQSSPILVQCSTGGFSCSF